MCTMPAEIKGYHSPDIENLNHYEPAVRDNFSFLLGLSIGPDVKLYSQQPILVKAAQEHG